MCCPLCAHDQNYPLPTRAGQFHRCRHCSFVWRDPSEHLTAQQEKAIYDRHENDTQDLGYRRFLARSLEPLLHYCPAPAQGLDFGCGPGPALIEMAQEHGYQMQAYDKFYAANEQIWQQRYDFITATEVVEHLDRPYSTLTRLWSLLHPKGLMIIQTKRVWDDERFSRWHYAQDPTHIGFFSEHAFQWLAQHLNAKLILAHQDVALLFKS